MQIVSEQPELCRELPEIVGNADYADFEHRLKRIDEVLVRSGLERNWVARGLERWEQAGRDAARDKGTPYRVPKAKALRRQQGVMRQALRCTLARHLTEKEYRGFSRRLAESELLRWFCGIARIDRMHIPSKSALHRYEQMVDEEDVRRLVNQLNVILSKSTDSGDAPLGLDEWVGHEVCWVDTTCVKANIHFPTDWVLLRDAVRTLMKSVRLIRGKGLKHRMEEPEE
ncbi:MAG: hypothetical protein O3C57_07145, partial [Verrucomicrobia bacterium]|nr:hypothetical protein [Verrucomicrobiota bacterium]